jgi:hypothetical protein
MILVNSNGQHHGLLIKFVNLLPLCGRGFAFQAVAFKDSFGMETYASACSATTAYYCFNFVEIVLPLHFVSRIPVLRIGMETRVSSVPPPRLEPRFLYRFLLTREWPYGPFYHFPPKEASQAPPRGRPLENDPGSFSE